MSHSAQVGIIVVPVTLDASQHAAWHWDDGPLASLRRATEHRVVFWLLLALGFLVCWAVLKQGTRTAEKGRKYSWGEAKTFYLDFFSLPPHLKSICTVKRASEGWICKLIYWSLSAEPWETRISCSTPFMAEKVEFRRGVKWRPSLVCPLFWVSRGSAGNHHGLVL